MLGAIRNWLTRWAIEKRRGIFRYFDGTRWRRADPLVVLRRLDEHPRFDPQTTPILAAEGDSEAAEILADTARFAFGLEELGDDRGVTGEEAVAVLHTFFTYCDELQKKRGSKPTLPPPTEREPSIDSTTKPASGCSSTPGEHTFDKPAELESSPAA